LAGMRKTDHVVFVVPPRLVVSLVVSPL